MQKILSIFGVIAIAALIFAGIFLPLQNANSATPTDTANFAETADEKEDKRTISVSGSYEVSAAPEKVEIHLSVESTALKAKDSQAKNADVSAKVLTALNAAGIPKTSIETTNYTLNENREWNEATRKYELKGYSTTNSLKISSTNINDAGKIIDAAVGAGANRVDSIVFSLTDAKTKELKLSALKKAGEETKQKAQTLADSVGVKIKQIESISEQSISFYPVYQDYYKTFAGASAESAPTEIIAGQIKVSAQVSAVYSIE